MKSKIAAACAAALMLTGVAQADTIYAPSISGSSFTDVLIGTITITSLSNLVGTVFAADSVNISFGGSSTTFSLDNVTFTSASIASLTDTDASATGFSFANVAAGTYELRASGTLDGTGQFSNAAFVGATFAASAVPEPQSYALMLAGLAAVGVVARRKKQA